MDCSRTRNVKLNAVWAIVSQILILIAGFVSRRVFLSHLGPELLGVNSLFSDVVMLFSFADLGFGTAIMFSIYKPIAENDSEKIKSFLLLYRNIYRKVILFLVLISFLIIPFLKSLKTSIQIEQLVLYYGFFQLNNIVSYFFAFRENYLIANQRERVLTVFNLVYNLIKNILQIVFVIKLHSFILYLIIGIFCTIVKKIIVNNYIKLNYPITVLDSASELASREKKTVVKKSWSLLITRVGNLLINQTDSTIVSYFISVTQWGYASNYLLIKKSVFMLSDKLYSSILPSFGNLLSTEKRDYQTNIFLLYDFINAWMQTFFFTGFICLSSLFVSLFFGANAVLDNKFVYTFFFAAFLDGLRAPISAMREAGGSFEQDKWYTIISAIVNLIISVLLVRKLGLAGVYIGTAFAMVVLHVSRTAILLKEKSYSISMISYFGLLIEHTVIGVVICGTSFFLIQLICKSCYGVVINVLIRVFIVLFFPNFLWILIYRRSANFNMLMKYVKKDKRRKNG